MIRLLFSIAGVLTLLGPAGSREFPQLKLYNTHTNESLFVSHTNGENISANDLDRLDIFLRDWRNDSSVKIDPKLYQIIWQLLVKLGAENETVEIVEGHRSAVKSGKPPSAHFVGTALDFRINGVSIKNLRNSALGLEAGGVGYYRDSFIHIDLGEIRHWPRVERAQLLKIFPDKNTRHIPRGGVALSHN